MKTDKPTRKQFFTLGLQSPMPFKILLLAVVVLVLAAKFYFIWR
jgi:hypothetical protein